MFGYRSLDSGSGAIKERSRRRLKRSRYRQRSLRKRLPRSGGMQAA